MQTDYDSKPLNGISQPQMVCRSAKLLHLPILTLDTRVMWFELGKKKERKRGEVTDPIREK